MSIKHWGEDPGATYPATFSESLYHLPARTIFFFAFHHEPSTVRCHIYVLCVRPLKGGAWLLQSALRTASRPLISPCLVSEIHYWCAPRSSNGCRCFHCAPGAAICLCLLLWCEKGKILGFCFSLGNGDLRGWARFDVQLSTASEPCHWPCSWTFHSCVS